MAQDLGMVIVPVELFMNRYSKVNTKNSYNYIGIEMREQD
jgi:hypothetical protein